MTHDRFSILVVAGETSGEQHAAGLIREIQGQNPQRRLSWFGAGGPSMRAAGVELLQDVTRLAAIGPWAAFFQLRSYWRLYRDIVSQVRRRRPRVAVLVDFPEFNLRLARRLKRMNISVCCFISPQVWAWRASRVGMIRQYVDLMLVILPFEEDFYRRQGVRACYVGNPSMARLKPYTSRLGSPTSRSQTPPIVALLPGSRRKEIEQIFPLQLDAARYVAERHPAAFWVVKAPGLATRELALLYDRWTNRGNARLNLEIREEPTERLLPQAECAIIKSGTSTLEAMILEVPFAMVYRIATPSWYLARPLVKTDVYCLANLIAGESIVPEFVQQDATAEKIGSYVLDLLRHEEARGRIKQKLRAASSRLGDRDAYRESAQLIARQFLN